MSVENKWVCNACGEEIDNTLYMQSVVMNSRATTFSQEGTSYILPDGIKCREWEPLLREMPVIVSMTKPRKFLIISYRTNKLWR